MERENDNNNDDSDDNEGTALTPMDPASDLFDECDKHENRPKINLTFLTYSSSTMCFARAKDQSLKQKIDT